MKAPFVVLAKLDSQAQVLATVSSRPSRAIRAAMELGKHYDADIYIARQNDLTYPPILVRRRLP